MALKDKAAMVDLSKIGAAGSSRGQVAKTAIGMHAEALFRDEKVSVENANLKHQLAAFQGAKPTRLLDPKTVFPSKWANRHEQAFANAEFEGLKREIESAGGNVQAILVRPRVGCSGEFEIVFGHRRHRACLMLGLSVLAVVDDLSDIELFCQMDRENRERASLRPFEVGVMYARALDDGLFPSARKLAESVGVDLSQLGKALALARLPTEVVRAFASPLDLQYRWVSELMRSIQSDPERILVVAQELQLKQPKATSSEVFRLLVGGGRTVPPPQAREVQLVGKTGQVGTLVFNASKKSVKVTLSKYEPSGFLAVEKAIQALLK